MTKSEIIEELQEIAAQKEACIELDDAATLYAAADALKNCVSKEFHERRLNLETKRRIKAEEKLELAQATNRQILENYVPKDEFYWRDATKEEPDETGLYLCVVSMSVDGGIMNLPDTRMFTDDGWELYGEGEGADVVTHWMPLPETPEDEEND